MYHEDPEAPAARKSTNLETTYLYIFVDEVTILLTFTKENIHLEKNTSQSSGSKVPQQKGVNNFLISLKWVATTIKSKHKLRHLASVFNYASSL